MNAVELKDIRVVYHTRQSGDRVALDNFSLCANNEMLALLGPNGAGKSTLLSIISQTLSPTQGRLVSPTSRNELAVVFQTPALDQLLTIRENLFVAGALHNLSKSQISDRIESICSELMISDRLDDQVRHLSGGLARRADLARALIPHPAVLLLDEPTTGLDIDARRIFWETLDRTRSRLGTTILLATHITDEANHADRVIMMRDGRMIQDDTPANLRATLGERIIRITIEDERDAEAVSSWLREHDIEHAVCSRLIIGHHASASLAESCPVPSASITIAPPSLEDAYTYYAQDAVGEDSHGVLS